MIVYISHMDIKEHIKHKGLTQEQYAEELNISRMTLHRALRGKAGRKTAAKLVEFSHGLITYDDIYHVKPS